mmetsp:Transcript_90089/g.160434  ORF Transcript_90089/g.160434 Transcript_90089/m.160434 type:complete len:484 (-) Transcript_90089:314-1765(-)|eukprot:CAMPEP_0197630720 /NCGR_PEP_ID=MMETSP1338-20131121/8104_1 /TAXON_ID=43686 ORGANISM="Pelagodinium beii, Strain RCC1491" /NCGR_SAMPLE_ID=MMETSP1338 /ASSEMBLY_ACC=CAM_ASM_000754 /LENGTH=483 /DNA_ID=CAMNT_0043202009 /DNA_START=78 /DNA_END=1529 /DNA_ORIENTATION=-
MKRQCSLLFHLIFLAWATEDDHEGHDHGEVDASCWTKNWEWAGAFHMDHAGWFNLEKVDGAYPDSTAKLYFQKAYEIVDAEPAAEVAWAGSATLVQSGATLQPKTLYELEMDQESYISNFKLDAGSGHQDIIIFFQHLPTEFEAKTHYFIDSEGTLLEPWGEDSILSCSASSTTEHTPTERWGEVILASVLTALPTLLGIGGMWVALSPKALSMATASFPALNAAASGVIFAAAVFLLLPEALFMASGSAQWGAFVILGWFLGMAIHHGSTILGGGLKKVANENEEVAVGATGQDEEVAVAEKTVKQINWAICAPVLAGDGFHNIADGFVLGIAFKNCDSSFAFKIMGMTIAHEVPQELADFLILVGTGNMSYAKAAAFNLLSGMTCLLGALISHGLDIAMETEACILAAGAGLYIFVALTELGPMIVEMHETPAKSMPWESAKRLIAFAIGATCIGLVLLDHEHCTPPLAEGEVDPHAGHNH